MRVISSHCIHMFIPYDMVVRFLDSTRVLFLYSIYVLFFYTKYALHLDVIFFVDTRVVSWSYRHQKKKIIENQSQFFTTYTCGFPLSYMWEFLEAYVYYRVAKTHRIP